MGVGPEARLRVGLRGLRYRAGSYCESCSHSHGVGIWKGWMMQQQSLNSLPITLQTEGLIPQAP